MENGCRVLSSVVASQFDTHGRYGGVVPELASREHLRAIVPVVREALDRAACAFPDLAAIAVTEGPGLVGSLLIGVTYAKALCFATGLPLIAVNHVEGHIHAVLLEQRETLLNFPALALVVSGGHTHLFEITTPGQYRLLGKTRDDAAGEAYDKVAKLLGFGYPGGPVLDGLAPYGNGNTVKFTRPRMKGNELDFSFSGLKTAVLRWVEQHDLSQEIVIRRQLLKAGEPPTLEQWLSVTPPRTLDLIASFQRSVVNELLRHAVASADQIGAASIIISGGVACNQGLRSAAAHLQNYQFLFPSPALSTDNAAMIAAAAFSKWEQQCFADFALRAKANLTLG